MSIDSSLAASRRTSCSRCAEDSRGSGSVVENPEAAPADVKLGLESDAGRAAATVIQSIVDEGVGGPGLSNRNEDASATLFESGGASFMVNWPFVYPRALGYVEAGTLEQSVVDDYGWTQYPAVVEGETSRPPYGGINIGVGAFSRHPDLAFQATQCITSDENQAYYFASNGNPASRQSVFEDPAVVEAFPMAPVIAQSLQQAVPRPQTAYYSEVSGSLQRTYHPPGSVFPGVTGDVAAELIRAVLAGEQLL